MLRYIAAGHSAAEAATHLGISPRTVETYRQRVSAKLGITHRADFLSFALQVGLLDGVGVP